jgi:hypothetical protein
LCRHGAGTVSGIRTKDAERLSLSVGHGACCAASIMRTRIAVALLLLAAPAVSQTSAFTYQGRLMDTGKPASGTYDLQFKLYDAATSGTVLGTVPIDDLAVSNGLFTVSLDFGASVFTGANRWLEVGVRPGSGTGSDPYTALIPRQLITSPPYTTTANRTRRRRATLSSSAAWSRRSTSSRPMRGSPTRGRRPREARCTSRTGPEAGVAADERVVRAAHVVVAGARPDESVDDSARVVPARAIPEEGVARTHRVGLAGLVPEEGVPEPARDGQPREVPEERVRVAGGLQLPCERVPGVLPDERVPRAGVRGAGARPDESAGANVTGSNNTFIGDSTGVPLATPTLTFAAAFGANASATVSHTIVLGTSQETVVVPGKLEVDTLGTAGATSLCLNASNRIATCSSSLRYKADVETFTPGLELVRRLRPISFAWKATGRQDVGFAAEEVDAVEPRFVTRDAQGTVEGVKYDRIAAVLVNALKEESTLLEAQRREIEELRARIVALETARR